MTTWCKVSASIPVDREAVQPLLKEFFEYMTDTNDEFEDADEFDSNDGFSWYWRDQALCIDVDCSMTWSGFSYLEEWFERVGKLSRTGFHVVFDNEGDRFERWHGPTVKLALEAERATHLGRLEAITHRIAEIDKLILETEQ